MNTTPSIDNNAVNFLPFFFIFYTLASVWLLIDGWITNFSSLHFIWSLTEEQGQFKPIIINLLFTIVGSLLGCAILGITSFHKYKAIYKPFDKDHIYGFYLAPVLAIAIGVLLYCLLNTGLLVLATELTPKNSFTSSLGYIAIGSIGGFNWQVFVKKLEELSDNFPRNNNNNQEHSNE